MKLKSILILAMVAIMAMAGGAMAATITTQTTTGTDVGGVLFAHGINIFGCGQTVGGSTTTCTIAGSAFLNFVADTTNGGGTGSGAALPAEPNYTAFFGTTSPGMVSAGSADPLTGYRLDQNLYGMCAATAGCSKFIPLSAASAALSNTANITAALLAAEGLGFGAPSNSTGPYNQGTFVTGMVSGFVDTTGGSLTNRISQLTRHNASAGGDDDLIDQRLATGVQTVTGSSVGMVVMNQATMAGGNGGVDSTVTLGVTGPPTAPPGAVNFDPYAGAFVVDGGFVSQQVGDNSAGKIGPTDIGSYGQAFQNANTVADLAPPAPTVAGTMNTYNPNTQALTP